MAPVSTMLLASFACAVVVASPQATGQQGPDGLASIATSATASSNTGASPTTSYREIFTVPASADFGAPLQPNIVDPQAVDAQTVCPGYTASNVKLNDLGFTATLGLAGKACNVYGTDIEVLNLTVEYQSADRLAVRILPAVVDATNCSFYILPDAVVHQPIADVDASATSKDNPFSLTWTNEPTFQFTVWRKETGDPIFDTRGSKLVYENQFIEFVSALPQNYNLYGLGESMHGLKLGKNFTKTMWAADVADPVDLNMYGSHPFYLDTRYYAKDPGNGSLTLLTSNKTTQNAEYVHYSHGVYHRNAHGQEILLRAQNITWRLLGGSVELYFYAGPTQPEVTKQYQLSAIGLPAMQQYFTLGYHQCRWGYANWSQLQEVVDNFEKANIPLENIWTDIDYMNQYRDFDNDLNTFAYAEGEKFLNNLHSRGQHYIPIIDSAIYIPNPQNASDNYSTYDRGNAVGAFMKNPDGSQYIGSVWPGYTVFPDWFANNTGSWWTDEMTRWHKLVAYDGAWIDMSEVSSFCVGSCGSGNLSLNPVHPPFALPGQPGNEIFDYPENFNLTNATEASTAASLSASQSSAYPMPATTSCSGNSCLRTTPTPGVRDINYPPYVINNVQGDLAVHAMSPNATHADNTPDYDVHNLFGHQILNATYNALLAAIPTKRPFIIGRSTFAGSGAFAGHWGGDNYSKWAWMVLSIPQMLSFSLFGIPMFGVDTCGFNGNTDAELCARWMQLSAFTPFYRNHNTLTAIPQEPYVWESVAAATRSAMQVRYLMLPYLYTQFYLAHTTGSTVTRALAWEVPDDPSLAAADRQFFFGPAVLVTPVLNQGATSVDGVFPGSGMGEVYYDYYNLSAVDVGKGANVTIEAPVGHIPLYLRGGYVVPVQGTAMVTREARMKDWGVIVALGVEGKARGELYVDDGESLVQNATLFVDFVATSNELHASPRGAYVDTNPLANVTVLGVAQSVSNVTLNGGQVPSQGVSWNQTSKALTITGLQNLTQGGAWKAEWVLKWS